MGSMQTSLNIGDLVVIKTNWRVVYTLIEIDGTNAICLTHDNKKEIIPLVALEKYDPVRAFGI